MILKMAVDDTGCEVVPTIEALIEEAKNGYQAVSSVFLLYDLTITSNRILLVLLQPPKLGVTHA